MVLNDEKQVPIIQKDFNFLRKYLFSVLSQPIKDYINMISDTILQQQHKKKKTGKA